MNPVHILLAMIAVLPYTAMRFADIGYIGSILIFFGYLIFSFSHYHDLSNKTGQTIWQTIKNDLPTFSKIDMKPWQFFLFLLIAAPFLLFFGAIIVAMFD